MDWVNGPRGRSYTATLGDCGAMVWHATTGEWTALVSRRQTALEHASFMHLQEAQAWCEHALVTCAATAQTNTQSS
jgi:hypothetical protein